MIEKFVAIMVCIGSPAHVTKSWMQGNIPTDGVCDVGEQVDTNGGDGFTEADCIAHLADMHSKSGNVVKMCVPDNSFVTGLTVEWER